jgi:hypothetical protein
VSPHSKAISEIQRLLKAVPDEIELVSKIHQMEKEANKGIDANTTRSFVLISVGILEHALAAAIGSHLIDDKAIRQKILDGDGEREGIIKTIYARNLIAHALDIYGSNTHKDINSVRQIRNLCAHAKSGVDFSSEKLKPLSHFHANGAVNKTFGLDPLPPRLVPKSPVHGMLMFLHYLTPYLIL